VSAFRIVDLIDVFELLDRCAPGHTRKATTHHWCIRWNGKTFPTLSLGAHGKGRGSGRTDIFAAHVRQMIVQLGISVECAKQSLPGLY
jgi:hypothetical protein